MVGGAEGNVQPPDIPPDMNEMQEGVFKNIKRMECKHLLERLGLSIDVI